MYREVCLLAVLFLNFGFILAEPLQMKNCRKVEYFDCSEAERDHSSTAKDSNIYEDARLEPYKNCRKVEYFDCSEAETDNPNTVKDPNHRLEFFILMVFDVLKCVHTILDAISKGIAIIIFILYLLLHGLFFILSEFISTLALILTWIFWFVQIIFCPVYSAIFNIVRIFLTA